MTLEIEHLHSMVNRKHGERTMLQYARSFSTSIKESVKLQVAWSSYYLTGSTTWYPLPVNTLQLKDVKFPVPIQPANMSNEDISLMREWVSSNGRVVRQRNVRQETTMAKAGTLPESAYHMELQPTSDQSDDIDDEIERKQDELNEYETEDDELSEDDAVSEFQTGEVGREANFLIGQRARYGRVVRLNNRLIH